MTHFGRIVAALPVLLAFHAFAVAQEPEVVGVALFPPNVIEGDSGVLEGFDIDLWRMVAEEADLNFEFRTLPLADLLEAVASGEVDAALAGLSVSASREARMDFSQPYMSAGLRILARPDDRPKLLRYVQTALDSGAFRALLYLIAFIIGCAHVFFFAERGSKSVSRQYFPGILEAAWFVIATMTTVGYGDLTPHRWLGRFVAFVVMVTGIGLFGVLVADLSTGMTLLELRSRISTPTDLAGRHIVTIRGSTSVSVATSYGATVQETDSIDDAMQALRGDEVDAFVFDGPPLLHYMRENPDEEVILLPQRLTTDTYAIAFPQGSSLREPVNRVLLQVVERGDRDRLYEQWFGAAP